jgi:hypothetical protein
MGRASTELRAGKRSRCPRTNTLGADIWSPTGQSSRRGDFPYPASNSGSWGAREAIGASGKRVKRGIAKPLGAVARLQDSDMGQRPA